MAPGFHARRCAFAKEYRYELSCEAVLSPLDAPFAVRADPRIDLGRLQHAAQMLLGRHDFSAFATAGGGWRSPMRRILAASWRQNGARISFRVVGDGFLRGMVRALVGTMLQVGLGRRPLEDLARLLEGGERGQAGPAAPARGLVLEQVYYPAEWSSVGAGVDRTPD
jgi:tRNA pseudouridine38-40 synthase